LRVSSQVFLGKSNLVEINAHKLMIIIYIYIQSNALSIKMLFTKGIELSVYGWKKLTAEQMTNKVLRKN